MDSPSLCVSVVARVMAANWSHAATCSIRPAPHRHLPGKHAAQSSPRPKNSAESIAVVLVKQILRTVCSAAWRDMNSIMEIHRIIQVGHWLCEEGLRETCANRCIQMVFMSASSAGCVVSYEVRQVLCGVIRYSPTPLSAFRWIQRVTFFRAGVLFHRLDMCQSLKWVNMGPSTRWPNNLLTKTRGDKLVHESSRGRHYGEGIREGSSRRQRHMRACGRFTQQWVASRIYAIWKPGVAASMQLLFQT